LYIQPRRTELPVYGWVKGMKKHSSEAVSLPFLFIFQTKGTSTGGAKIAYWSTWWRGQHKGRGSFVSPVYLLKKA
jgi:hypothetical protein